MRLIGAGAAVAAVAAAAARGEEPAIVLGGDSKALQPSVRSSLDVLSEKVDHLALAGSGQASEDPAELEAAEHARHEEAEDEHEEIDEAVEDEERLENEAREEGELEGAGEGAERAMKKIASEGRAEAELTNHGLERLLKHSARADRRAEDALEAADRPVPASDRGGVPGAGAGKLLRAESDEVDDDLEEADELIDGEHRIARRVEDAERREEETLLERDERSGAPGAPMARGPRSDAPAAEAGPAPPDDAVLAVGVADHPCPCIEQMMEDPCPPELVNGRRGAEKEGCAGILARAAAEERLRGDIESVKKIVKHPEWSSGTSPKLVTKNVRVSRHE